MKKPWTDRFGDFMAGKGFYIVLFLCVAAIGVSGYYLFSSLAGDGNIAAVAGITQGVVVTPSVAPEPPANLPSPTPVKPSVAPNKPAPSPSPTPSTAPSASVAPSSKAPGKAKPASAAATVFTWPVKGQILDAYSPDHQRYDVTMADWRTHAGIDIAAELGTQVKAAAKGVVLSIENDQMMGTVLTIDHGGDVVSVYANLSALPTVSVGDHVGVGDVIGAVGSTAIAESNLAAHLHLAFFKGGSPADPLKYLPEQQ